MFERHSRCCELPLHLSERLAVLKSLLMKDFFLEKNRDPFVGRTRLLRLLTLKSLWMSWVEVLVSHRDTWVGIYR